MLLSHESTVRQERRQKEQSMQGTASAPAPSRCKRLSAVDAILLAVSPSLPRAFELALRRSRLSHREIARLVLYYTKVIHRKSQIKQIITYIFTTRILVKTSNYDYTIFVFETYFFWQVKQTCNIFSTR